MIGSAVFRTRGALVGPWARNLLWRNARAVPTLDLGFADTKSLRDAISGQDLVTFTRASSATYVGSDGLVKTAVTNLLLRSEEFGTTWTPTGASISSNVITAPNGTLTADTITEDSSTGDHRINQASLSLSNGLCTYSVYLKASTRSAARIQFDGTVGGTASSALVDINLSTGITSGLAVTGNIASGSAVVSVLPDGWYRVSLTSSLSAAATGISTRIFLLQSAGGASSYSGNGTGSVYIWGAQLEQSATVGDYIPTTSTINSAPRFDHNPTTGESLGLLVEEARTNLLLRSEEFDNAAWTLFGTASRTANTTAAPDGTTSADSVTLPASSGIYQLISGSASTTYTFSVWIRCNTTQSVKLVINTNLSDPTTLTVTATSSWQRFNITKTTSIGTTTVTAQMDTGGGNTFFLWGTQLEAGAFATSYIPTTTATVTRAADVASITGSNFSSFYNQTEGTVFAEWFGGPVATNKFPSVAAARQASASNSQNTVEIFQGPSLANVRANGLVRVSNVDQISRDSGDLTLVGTKAKAALGVRTNDFVFTANGVQVGAVDTSGTLPTVDTFNIGFNSASEQLNGRISRLTYWPTRLANPTLVSITQP